ncbi:MAG: acetyl-CoA carboxylase biotin carboxylase subunit family protein [Oligoflexales bacterium]
MNTKKPDKKEFIKNILFCKWDHVFLKTALESNHVCHLVLDKYDAKSHDFNKELADKCASFITVSSFDSIEELSAVAGHFISSEIKIDFVVSNGEYGHYGAGLLGSIFEVPNINIHSVTSVRDKILMKKMAVDGGLRAASYTSIPDISDISNFKSKLRHLSYPLVLKPSNGVGTRYTYILKNDQDLKVAAEEISSNLCPPLYSRSFIIEEFIPGEEYNIDAVWLNGKPVLFSIAKYFSPVIQYKNSTVGLRILNKEDHEELYEELYSMNIKANKIFNIRNGLTHMQVLKEPGKPAVFTEIATRHCGGYGCEAIEKKWGIDNREAFIRILLGCEKSDLAFNETPHKHVGYFNVSPENPGVVVNSPNPEEIKKFNGVLEVKQCLFDGEDYANDYGCNWTMLVLVGTESIDKFHEIVNTVNEKFKYQTVGN